MRKRKLGRQGLMASELGLGCMGMSEFYGPVDETEALATIHRATALGIDMLDTADIYGLNANEELVARAIRDRRHRVVLATKFGIVRGPDGQIAGVNGRPEYVRQACEGSLRRLRVETIDLYYQHRVDPQVPIEETVGAMARLVEQGKVRFLGLSEAAPQTIRRAHATHPISAVQSEYSLWTRDPEESVLPTLRELGIGFVAYSPLGRGFLTGRWRSQEEIPIDDWRRQNPRFTGVNFRRNLALADKLRAMATRRRLTAAQLALAWVLAQGEDVVPIPGTKRRKYLEENAVATEVRLADKDLEELSAAMPPGIAAGARYPDMSHIDH